jgi:HD-like signal output (HDOD) protein
MSSAYRPQHTQVDLERRKHWRLPQWTAYLTTQRLPVMPRSKQALHALEAEKGGDLTVDELVALANADPFLCLCLLREAEEKRSSRLGHETATQFAAVMQLGATAFRELLITSPEADETHIGLAECEARAVLAGQLAAAWSSSRADASPDEVLMAALLSEIGELLLWHFAPELPQSAKELLETGKAARSAEAQEAICGFKFQDLTVTCAEAWKLPPILIQLIRGHDNVRARIARLSRDTARHLVAGPDNPALPDDLAKAKELLPQASMEYLVAGLRQIPPEMQPDLVDRANQALHKSTDA